MTTPRGRRSPRNYTTQRFKAPVLLAIFHRKYDPSTRPESIPVTIEEVITTTQELGYTRPGNIHNFFKDFVRAGPMPRSLREIADQGYRLVQVDRGGEFVRAESDDLRDDIQLPPDLPIREISSRGIPTIAFDLIRADEGGAVSAVEYCGILAEIAGAEVVRVQSPVKVQPNEIDGCYVFSLNEKRTVYCVEAKSKGRDVLLKHQILGEAAEAYKYFGSRVDVIIPVGLKIEDDNTVYIVLFGPLLQGGAAPQIEEIYRFKLEPVPPRWLDRRTRGTRKERILAQ